MLWAAGGIFVALGTLGVFLPLLPGTPFFLLAAACFGKSSPRAYRWLTTNRWFGRHLEHYRDDRGATVPAKVFSIGTLWLGIGGSAYLFRDTTWVAVVLAVVAVAVTVYLVRLRTVHG
ncbi:MAG: YbaN family protein [Dehalococcoidia bacterium]|nr:YbaN family protein [Dehalococcoidia bacterium]